MIFALHQIPRRFGEIRKLLRLPAPILLRAHCQTLARIAPPGRVIPPEWATVAISDLGGTQTATLLRGEPVVVTWMGSPALVLVPFGF